MGGWRKLARRGRHRHRHGLGVTALSAFLTMQHAPPLHLANADGATCAFPSLNQNCPIGGLPEVGVPSAVLDAVAGNSTLTHIRWWGKGMEAMGHNLDYMPFCTVDTELNAKDFMFMDSEEAHARSWTAKARSPMSMNVAGATCGLESVVVKRAQQVHGDDFSAEVRFVMTGCSNGRSAVVSVYTGPQQGVQWSLVKWMCALEGARPGRCKPIENKVAPPKRPDEADVVIVQHYAEATIGKGKCSDPELVPTPVEPEAPVANKEECRLRCANLIGHDIQEVHCSGYSYNVNTRECILYQGASPYAGLSSSDGDENGGWVCHSMHLSGDQDMNGGSGEPTSAGGPDAWKTQVTMGLQAILGAGADMGAGNGATMATRNQVKVPEGFSGEGLSGCYGPVDYYVLDRKVSVSSEDWATLLRITDQGPYPGTAPAVPASMGLDRICVMSCFGDLPEPCQEHWPPITGVSLFLNFALLCACLVLAYKYHTYTPAVYQKVIEKKSRQWDSTGRAHETLRPWEQFRDADDPDEDAERMREGQHMPGHGSNGSVRQPSFTRGLCPS